MDKHAVKLPYMSYIRAPKEIEQEAEMPRQIMQKFR